MSDVYPYAKTHQAFERHTATHEMTVLLDEGLYRHLRFRRPDTILYWFDVVTWPGNLVIRGDMGTYAFAREEDMFAWFAGGPTINPGYWSEKVTAGKTQDFDPDLARREVIASFIDWAEFADPGADEMRDLWGDLHKMLDEFGQHEETLRDELQHVADGDPFHDFWEVSFQGFTWHYLWCCWAIRHAIDTYRTATAVSA